MPKCFISYSWDNDEHKEWVKTFATTLRKDGIETILDQWHIHLGDQLTHFMEKAISESDYVLIICTPKYKNKSDNREGGVGYEGDILTAELYSNRNQRKFIPILKSGNWNVSLPIWLNGKAGIDLSQNPYSDNEYNDLTSTLHNIKDTAPAIGSYVPPKSTNKPSTNISIETKNEETKILGILVDEVSIPKNDGTRGSALYSIPFKLNNAPSRDWCQLFVDNWNFPPSFTTMHRPGIASVSYNKIILNGTTIDEVKKYHRDTLVLVVEKTNQDEAGIISRKNKQEQRKRDELEMHKSHVTVIAEEITF